MIKEYVIDLHQKLPSLHNIVLSHPDFTAAANEDHGIVRLDQEIQITKNMTLSLKHPMDAYIIFRDLHQTMALISVDPNTVLICYSDTTLKLGMLLSDLLYCVREIRVLLMNPSIE